MDDHETNGESFADMLDAYGPPEGGDAQVGDLVRGTVMDITDDSVFVDTGTKLDGVAERTELTGDDGELTVAVGDEVELYVVARDGGGIRLSRAIAGVGGLHMLEQAMENALPVEGRVTGTVKGGFNVDVLQRRAFCPVSQMDTAYVEDTEQYVGQAFQFLVIKLEQRGRNVVISRRQLLEREREEEARRLESELHEGDEVSGRVMRLASFGAFVEIGPGVEGAGAYLRAGLEPGGRAVPGRGRGRRGPGQGVVHGARQEGPPQGLPVHAPGHARSLAGCGRQVRRRPEDHRQGGPAGRFRGLRGVGARRGRPGARLRDELHQTRAQPGRRGQCGPGGIRHGARRGPRAPTHLPVPARRRRRPLAGGPGQVRPGDHGPRQGGEDRALRRLRGPGARRGGAAAQVQLRQGGQARRPGQAEPGRRGGREGGLRASGRAAHQPFARRRPRGPGTGNATPAAPTAPTRRRPSGAAWACWARSSSRP